MTLDYLKSRDSARSRLVQSEGELLVLQDTTELNFNQLNGLLNVTDEHLGVISDNKSTGFLMHGCLALEAQSGLPLSLCEVEMFTRRFGRQSKKERAYHKQAIEEKESFRWISSLRSSKSMLPQGRVITFISDRESDIYEYLCEIKEQGCQAIVRSTHDRQTEQHGKLTELLADVAVGSRGVVELSATTRRAGRSAVVSLKWSELTLPRPEGKHKIGWPDELSLSVVEVKEEQPPEGETPLYWRLLTTKPVGDEQTALEVVSRYKQRWWIEDLFRILKSQGFEIERSRFSTGLSLQKMALLSLQQAVEVLLLRQEREGQAGLKADYCFDEDQQVFMSLMSDELSGSTTRLSNPYDPESLAFCVWVIARMGGWQAGNKGKAGVISIARGLVRFKLQYQGWRMAKLIEQRPHDKQTTKTKKDVYTN